MSCIHCGHDDWVTIGKSKYCAHCGEVATGAAEPTTAPSHTPAPAASAAPVAMPQPKAFSDLKPTGPTVSQPNPAHSYHARPATPAPAGALDLRPTTGDAKAKLASVTRQLDMRVPKPALAQPKAQDRADRAASIPKSPAISRFKSDGAKLLPDTPAVASAPAPAISTQPDIVTPQASSIPAPAEPVADAAPLYNELPNQVLSQIQKMQNLIPATDANGTKVKPPKPAKAPKAVSIAAAGMAAAVMAGYIWLNNYDSLTIKAAAQKAGIAATAPSYLPASYSLAGKISFGSGFVSLQYKSPASSELISINQRKSDWTASSLLELYVNKQSKTYLSVQTQGLTIYLLDNNQATWVNRGIQYVLQGNSLLNHDQLLKIAESL